MDPISSRPLLKRGVESSSLIENAGSLIYSNTTKRFLFLLRNSPKRHRSTWGLVGGRLENNERPIQGLYREAKEEVGVDLANKKVVPIETFTSEDLIFRYYTFLIVVNEEFIPRLNSEHRGYAWVNLNDYPTPLHPGVWKTFNFKSVLDKIQIIQDLL